MWQTCSFGTGVLLVPLRGAHREVSQAVQGPCASQGQGPLNGRTRRGFILSAHLAAGTLPWPPTCARGQDASRHCALGLGAASQRVRPGRSFSPLRSRSIHVEGSVRFLISGWSTLATHGRFGSAAGDVCAADAKGGTHGTATQPGGHQRGRSRDKMGPPRQGGLRRPPKRSTICCSLSFHLVGVALTKARFRTSRGLPRGLVDYAQDAVDPRKRAWESRAAPS